MVSEIAFDDPIDVEDMIPAVDFAAFRSKGTRLFREFNLSIYLIVVYLLI